jgi:hypothetical protein
MKEQKEQHPILNQVLTPEFLKQFKDSGELNSFMEELYARAMEQMLEGEMDGHLGYVKHSSEGIIAGTREMESQAKRSKRLWERLNWRSLGIEIAPSNRF